MNHWTDFNKTIKVFIVCVSTFNYFMETQFRMAAVIDLHNNANTAVNFTVIEQKFGIVVVNILYQHILQVLTDFASYCNIA